MVIGTNKHQCSLLLGDKACLSSKATAGMIFLSVQGLCLIWTRNLSGVGQSAMYRLALPCLLLLKKIRELHEYLVSVLSQIVCYY
jgi:hypothetical protein